MFVTPTVFRLYTLMLLTCPSMLKIWFWQTSPFPASEQPRYRQLNAWICFEVLGFVSKEMPSLI